MSPIASQSASPPSSHIKSFEIESLRVPSPIPTLNSSTTIVEIYFASVGEAEVKSSKSINLI